MDAVLLTIGGVILGFLLSLVYENKKGKKIKNDIRNPPILLAGLLFSAPVAGLRFVCELGYPLFVY